MNQPNTSSKLAQLRQMTTVVADTGDLASIRQFQPQDATTNPSLLLKTLQSEQSELFFNAVLREVKQHNVRPSVAELADRLAVRVGCEVLSIIPGLISTEVDARLSFDTAATLTKARRLIALYAAQGIQKERVLIKIASTWEGIQAAKILEQEGIHCNLTLLFGFAQALACADARVTLISPFVGRILDWHKARSGKTEYAPQEDPGVLSVQRIFRYYKAHGFNTIVMGASFRNLGEIEALAGCDRLTISPALLEQLESQNGALVRTLNTADAIAYLNDPSVDALQSTDERTFRWQMNEDAMATEKLAEGIRLFAEDQRKLETLIQSKS
ncbi:Transaldolase [gamma proteobacterium HdN1]|nr:Transaldolase [gamma proteobacterium HdN1]